jgi:hypothetical protein
MWVTTARPGKWTAYNNSAHPFLEADADVPIVLCGDITQTIHLVDFMNTFSMDCATRATLGNTCLVLINDTSYFLYHRPVLTEWWEDCPSCHRPTRTIEYSCDVQSVTVLLRNNIRKRLLNYIITTVLISFIVINMYLNWNKSNIVILKIWAVDWN